jgi:hypothetical protein
MIHLIPSQSILKETKIDFELLSFIISRFTNLKRNVKIKVYKSKTNYSAFYVGLNIIEINLKEDNSLKYYISTLLHEIRHLVQVKTVKKKLLFSYDNYIEYFCSPEEKDARKFEKLSTEVCKIYNCYKIIEKKIKKLKLDSLKELEYNEGVQERTKNNKTEKQ